MDFNHRDVDVTTYRSDDISKVTVRFWHKPTGILIEIEDRAQHKAIARGMLEMEKLVSADKSTIK